MELEKKKLSEVQEEQEFTSQSSKHLIVEDGGEIKRLSAEDKLLPELSSEDTNKILGTNSLGTYVLKDEKDFIITFTGNDDDSNASCDKTYKEISDAINNKKNIMCVYYLATAGNGGTRYKLSDISYDGTNLLALLKLEASGTFNYTLSKDGYEVETILCKITSDGISAVATVSVKIFNHTITII